MDEINNKIEDLTEDIKKQNSEISKLTTGFADGKPTAQLGKQASGLIVKTDEEATLLKSITFISDRLKELKDNGYDTYHIGKWSINPDHGPEGFGYSSSLSDSEYKLYRKSKYTCT